MASSTHDGIRNLFILSIPQAPAVRLTPGLMTLSTADGSSFHIGNLSADLRFNHLYYMCSNLADASLSSLISCHTHYHGSFVSHGPSQSSHIIVEPDVTESLSPRPR
jgi:hypothetical protein